LKVAIMATANILSFILYILWTASILCHGQLTETNQWEESTGADGSDLWYSTSDFVPVQSQSFGTIQIGRIMTVEFDFVFGGRTNDPKVDQSEMFFRVGYDSTDGTSCDAQNSRYPSFWLDSHSQTVFVSASDATSCYNYYYLSDYGAIAVGVSYHFLIAFNDTTLWIEISGGDNADWSQHWSRSAVPSEHCGESVPVWWMSGKFGSSEYNRGNGTFSNVVITSSGFTFSSPPTPQPTADPTAVTENTLSAGTGNEGESGSTGSNRTAQTTSLSTTGQTQAVVYDDGGVWNPHLNGVGAVVVVVVAMVVTCCLLILCIFVAVMRHQMKALDDEMRMSKQMRRGTMRSASHSPSSLSPWSPVSSVHPPHGVAKEFSPPPTADSTGTTMTSVVTHEYPLNGVASPRSQYFRPMATRPPLDVLPATSTSSPQESASSTMSSHPSDTGSVLDGLETMYGVYTPSHDQQVLLEGRDREKIAEHDGSV